MKTFKIVKDNNPLLRKSSVDVELPLSNEDNETILNMLEYLKLSNDEEYTKTHPNVRAGVGLAAPQIGILKKMIVIYIKHEGERPIQYCLVNPKIISESVKKSYLEHGEGCLSVDDPHEGYIYRSYKIKVKAYDAIKKEEVLIVADEFLSVVLQHEIDHLKGVLFYDHINKENPFIKLDNSIVL